MASLAELRLLKRPEPVPSSLSATLIHPRAFSISLIQFDIVGARNSASYVSAAGCFTPLPDQIYIYRALLGN